MKRPSAPLVISLAALFFSLTGAGFAAQSDLASGRASSIGIAYNVYGPAVTMCAITAKVRPCDVQASLAACPPGVFAVGGGWVGIYPHNLPVNATVGWNGPRGREAWLVDMTNNSTSSATFKAVVVCAY